MDDLKEDLKELKELKMYYTKSEEYFCPTESFSGIKLKLSHKFDTVKRYIKFGNFLKPKESVELLQQQQETIEDVMRTECKFQDGDKEIDVVIKLAKTLRPLCRKVLLENKYREVVERVAKELTLCPLGLGTADTWHGSPDMRLFPLKTEQTDKEQTDIVVQEEGEVDEEEEEEKKEDEIGDDINVEGKRDAGIRSKKVMAQLVATTVTTAFTNCQVFNKPLSAVLLLCKRNATVCMYECQRDILFMSESIPLCIEQTLTRKGVLLVWSVLHLRYACISLGKVH